MTNSNPGKSTKLTEFTSPLPHMVNHVAQGVVETKGQGPTICKDQRIADASGVTCIDRPNVHYSQRINRGSFRL